MVIILNSYVETKNILKKYNIVANKKLGQNFLIDDTVIDNIIIASDINVDDLIIEIGPGLRNAYKKANWKGWKSYMHWIRYKNDKHIKWTF